MRPILLASGSPRRRELLTQAGIPFEVIPSDAEELTGSSLPLAALVEENARRKACSVSALRPGRIVLGADTLVCIGEHRLGKPKDRADAERMLRMLSGKSHRVVTGICLTDGKRTVSESVSTLVRFRTLSEARISAYLDTGEYADKAGAYAIQGKGCVLVERLEGDFYNVVGLPVCRVSELLESFLGEVQP